MMVRRINPWGGDKRNDNAYLVEWAFFYWIGYGVTFEVKVQAAPGMLLDRWLAKKVKE